MVMNCETLKSPLFLIKILELAMAVVCTVLSSVHPVGVFQSEYFYKMELVHGTFLGFCLVSSVVILGYVSGNALKAPLVMVISGVAAAMFFMSCVFVFQAHMHYSENVQGAGNLIGAGIMAVFTFIVYLLDLGLTYKNIGVVVI